MMREIIVSEIAYVECINQQDPQKSFVVKTLGNIPDDHLLRLRFKNGAEGLMHTGHEYEKQIRLTLKMAEDESPVFMAKIGLDGRLIELTIPLLFVVDRVSEDAHGNLQVQFSPAAAMYEVRRSHPDFLEMKRNLEFALASKQLVAVRPSPEDELSETEKGLEGIGLANGLSGLQGGPIPKEFAEEILDDDPEQIPENIVILASKIFDHVKTHDYPSNLGTKNLDIAFRFPDEGCWARAHQMSVIIDALMKRESSSFFQADLTVNIKKIFVEPDSRDRKEPSTDVDLVQAASTNHPKCTVTWFFHMATMVEIVNKNTSYKFVIDPSLFMDRGPVSRQEWRSAIIRWQVLVYSTSREVYVSRVKYHNQGKSLVCTFESLREDKYHRQMMLGLKLVFVDRLYRNPPPYEYCSQGDGAATQAQKFNDKA